MRAAFDVSWLERRTIPEPNSGCWLWLGGCTGRGYGTSWDPFARRWAQAHRIAYRYLKGEIPDGMCVCHACDNPLCCNPDHLFLGTRFDNAQDRERKGRAKPRRGIFHGNAKLTEQQVLEIRAATGTQQSIANRYRVSANIISLIKHGKIWRSI
jgi:hypothetical protein